MRTQKRPANMLAKIVASSGTWHDIINLCYHHRFSRKTSSTGHRPPSKLLDRCCETLNTGHLSAACPVAYRYSRKRFRGSAVETRWSIERNGDLFEQQIKKSRKAGYVNNNYFRKYSWWDRYQYVSINIELLSLHYLSIHITINKQIKFKQNIEYK